MTPSEYAQLLLQRLPCEAVAVAPDHRQAGELWARSGAMWLSGHAKGPPRPCPAPLASCAQGAWLALAALAPQHLAPDFEAYRLLGERAAIAGLSRQGRTSAGGACRLWDTADGVLALNLAREDDLELLPAWTEGAASGVDDLAGALPHCAMEPLVARARLLGLAAAAVMPPQPQESWFRATPCAPSFTRASLSPPPAAQQAAEPAAESALAANFGQTPLVVDLSALWAGPLCGQLLRSCGARVIKVESARRPDGARYGPPALFDLLNTGKESVQLDFACDHDVGVLKTLLSRADIVIEGTRPRALEQLGIVATEVVAARPGQVWLSITGYGRDEPQREWIAYGDDAAVAAGLSWLMGGDRGDPVFGGDAIADPLTGLHSALTAYAYWLSGGGVVLDVALHNVVSWCLGMPATSGNGTDVAAEPPVARTPTAPAAALGADTERVLAWLEASSHDG